MPDITVMAFIESMSDQSDADSVWRSFLKFVEKFGYTHGGLADMPGPLERLEETLLFLDWPDEWAKRYLAKNYVHHDPARLHLAQTSAPYHWTDMLAAPHYTKAQKAIVYEASEYSLNHGFIIPFGSSYMGQAMITVAGHQVDDDPMSFAQIQLAALYAHTKIRSLAGTRKSQPAPHLSMRERECLQWAASGKSNWEIGEILAISEKTAATHLSRIKQKYGVATRLQAIVAGLRNGYVHT